MIDSVSEINYLNKDQSKKLLGALSNIKHRLIVLLMLDGGLRVSECVSLKVSNFDFKQRKLKVESLKKRSKKKFRSIPLSIRLYDCLADYLYKHKFDNDSWLFPSSTSKEGHITRFAVNKLLDRKKYKLNIQNLHPHALRHTCATAQLANGAELVHIKELLGHENLNTTTIYTHVPDEILRSNIERATYEKKGLFQKLKTLLFGEKSKKLISISQNINLPAIGRTDVVDKLQSYANRDINTILLGPIGVGKSHILQNLDFGKRKVLKLDDADNIKKSLIYLLLYLYQNDKEQVFNLLYSDFTLDQVETKLNRESIKNLCCEIQKLVNPKEYILLIDSVDRITPRAVKALEELKDTFTIITSAREIPINKSSFLWNFEIMKIEPLKRTFALELIQKLSYDLQVEDYDLFKNHIWEQSNGNPRVIYELVERYRKEPVITTEVVREITHFGSKKEIDMSMLIILFLASLAVLRYLSHEVDNESMRFIGGAAMVLLVLLRYFFKFTKRRLV